MSLPLSPTNYTLGICQQRREVGSEVPGPVAYHGLLSVPSNIAHATGYSAITELAPGGLRLDVIT